MSRQDIENFAPQRILLLEELATKLGFTQAILFTHSQESSTVVTTWGADAVWAAQAAAGANAIKKGWGWPEDTIVESAKVEALHARIAELEAQVEDLQTKLDDAPEWPTLQMWVDGDESTTFSANYHELCTVTYDEHGSAGLRVAKQLFEQLAEELGTDIEVIDAVKNRAAT